MPLKNGSSEEVISNNISEMQAAGHPHNVAVAAALHNADKYAFGGIIPSQGMLGNMMNAPAHMPMGMMGAPQRQGIFGGGAQPSTHQPTGGFIGNTIGGALGGLQGIQSPSAQPQHQGIFGGGAMPQRIHHGFRAEGGLVNNEEGYAAGGKLGQMKPMHMKNHPPHFGGLFKTDGPGRVDNIHMSVPKNSYIIPSDVVSGLGQGNSAAGGKILSHMFPTSAGGGSGSAKNSFMNKFAKGGHVDGHEMVPIVVAGGEFHVMPHDVQNIGKGHMQSGHKILDHFVKHVRDRTIKEMKNLKGPKR